jgi:hypothetical protein|tara:strand:- start:236 stop:553 length:318 start_codon:yes stop_codon:yes gene_type:complete
VVDTVVADNHLAGRPVPIMVVPVVLVVEQEQVIKKHQDQQRNQELIHLHQYLTMDLLEVQGIHRLVRLLEVEVLVALEQALTLLQQIHLDLVELDDHSQTLQLHL